MIDDQVFTDAEAYIALGKNFAEQGLPWHDIARLGVALEYERWSKVPGLVLLVALTLHYKDEDVASWARQSNEEELSQLRRIYEVLLKVYDRKMRPGLTIDHLAVAVSDLVTGMTINGRIMPETRNVMLDIDMDGDGKPEQWHLCALAAWSIYDSFTELADG